MLTSWLFLVTAIVLEVMGTTSMKLSEGFSKPLPSLLIFVCYGASLFFLTLALKRLDVGLSYAIWSGLGTMMIVLIGLLLFGERLNMVKVLSIILIITGVVGLNLSGLSHS